jgi:hypothetical protein
MIGLALPSIISFIGIVCLFSNQIVVILDFFNLFDIRVVSPMRHHWAVVIIEYNFDNIIAIPIIYIEQIFHGVDQFRSLIIHIHVVLMVYDH